ncbi:winged helix-turn-helix transcriptional regulator [Streptosporangium sp. NPDC050855]|uniref:winged helix-turn-helix transcriptional regulator n=1 Tax=Streptosporangium sp. NPDC050855 TaxID=3366194 RepID=UPI00378CCE56
MKEGRRHYGQYCGLAAALDVIGERWTLLIVRELLVAPRRYNELLANLPGIGTNLLAVRLRLLGEAGVVEQLTSDPDGRARRYRLTETGQSLRPVVLGLARWGMPLLAEPDPHDEVRPEWSLVAVEAMMRTPPADGPDECYQFQIAGKDGREEVFHLEVKEGTARIVPGRAVSPDLLAVTDAVTFVEIGAGRLDPLEAVVLGRLRLDGDSGAVLRCCRLLGLIPPTA